MGKIGNLKNVRDVSDMDSSVGQAISQGHTSGRRTKNGMKEQHLSDARSSNKTHVKSFRSGSQDARGSKGPESRHPQTTRRRSSGPGTRIPSPSGGV